jgi:PHD/YefM family antitoxin component YafN of YafNO toxin-antitoxin module
MSVISRLKPDEVDKMFAISSRDFNQDISSAKRKSVLDPVVITDRGTPTHVLLSYTEYQKMLTTQPKVTDLLSLGHDINFEPSKINMTAKPVDFD